MSYTVELASKGFYRLLTFNNPRFYKDSHNVRFVRFLNLMRRQTVHSSYINMAIFHANNVTLEFPGCSR